MIKKYYYSTLNKQFYATKEEAQKAEDKFVENYFIKLHEDIQNKKSSFLRSSSQH